VALDHPPLLGGQPIEDRLEGYQLTIDEGTHPCELRLELRLGLEIPRHAHPNTRLGLQRNLTVFADYGYG